jgi:hypothetical protein
MSGFQRAGFTLLWSLCALATVALYASIAHQFASVSGDTIGRWVDGADSGYAALYAPMHGS